MKFTVIGLVLLLILTATSSTEAISMWGPLVLMWLVSAVVTMWVVAGEPRSPQAGAGHKKAA